MIEKIRQEMIRAGRGSDQELEAVTAFLEGRAKVTILDRVVDIPVDYVTPAILCNNLDRFRISPREMVSDHVKRAVEQGLIKQIPPGLYKVRICSAGRLGVAGIAEKSFFGQAPKIDPILGLFMREVMAKQPAGEKIWLAHQPIDVPGMGDSIVLEVGCSKDGDPYLGALLRPSSAPIEPDQMIAVLVQ